MKCIQDFGWETRRKEITYNIREYKDDIKMNLKEIKMEEGGLIWIRTGKKWQAVLKTANDHSNFKNCWGFVG